MSSNLIPAILNTYEPATLVDPDKLIWAPGYPSFYPKNERLRHSAYDRRGEVAQASLWCAIVEDRVSHLVVGSPGVTHYEQLKASYDYVQDDRLKSWEGHHVYVAWRVVRESDGKVLYDSLTEAGEHHRVVHANVPLGWGEVIHRLRCKGELPSLYARAE